MATGSRNPSGGSDTAEPHNVFAAEINRWRVVRGWSRTALAKQMGYDRSYVSKVESGAERPSREFAFHAEAALRAGGAIRRAFNEYRASHERGRLRPVVPSEGVEPLGSLVVDHDDATLSYDQGTYRLTQRRRLVNGGGEPISRYLIRISVDRYPDDPERSNDLYGAFPLTWEEINLRAWLGEGRVEPMDWRVHHDREAFKEVWLLFQNDSGRFPLYPGDSCWIEYEYTIADEHWGYWFQRAIRLPTAAVRAPGLPHRARAGGVGPVHVDDRRVDAVRHRHRADQQRRPRGVLLGHPRSTAARSLPAGVGLPGPSGTQAARGPGERG
jgi:transcriptional regulator with XRE-family HTH domain